MKAAVFTGIVCLIVLPLAGCGRLGVEQRPAAPPPAAAPPPETFAAPSPPPVTAAPLPPPGSAAPAPQAAPLPAAPQAAPGAATPAGSGALGGGLGAQLSDADRQMAMSAQYDAVTSGQKKTWKGGNGTFGFTDPGQINGTCRTYTDTVYVGGRSQSGKGQACQGADGAWQFTN